MQKSNSSHKAKSSHRAIGAAATMLMLVAVALPGSAAEEQAGTASAPEAPNVCEVLQNILQDASLEMPEPEDCSFDVDPCKEGTCDCPPEENCEPPVSACPPGQVGLVIRTKSFCQDTPVQCDSGIGVEPVCVVIEQCEPPRVGVIINRLAACATVPRIEFCQGGELGIIINGNSFCQPLPAECDEPALGVDPVCVEFSTCDPPAIGIIINNFEACFTVEACQGSQVGLIINGFSACVAFEDPCDHAPESPWDEGVFLVSACGDDYYLPPIPVDPGPCPSGSTTYSGRYGETWCATVPEIVQDSLPDNTIPLVFEENEEHNLEAELQGDESQPAVEMDEFEPDFFPLIPTGASTQSQGTCSDFSTTCNMIFIRGFDGGSTTGYGGFAPMKDWFTARGYSVEMVDTYGRCVGTANPMTHGSPHADPHDVWFAGHHAGANSCSSTGHHDTDTDMRHMAYHLAWWIYDTYDTEAVDVVAHSMGGLLIRYALTMVDERDPNWPPYINVQDVVTLGTPHTGTGWACWATHTQGKNMCGYKSTMKWMKANSQNPQGMVGTDWTLMAADEDSIVSEKSGVGMVATHKLWYNKNTGGMSNTAYGHNDYYKDDSTSMDGSYYWQNAGDWKKSKAGPHSIKRAWWGSVSPGH